MGFYFEFLFHFHLPALFTSTHLVYSIFRQSLLRCMVLVCPGLVYAHCFPLDLLLREDFRKPILFCRIFMLSATSESSRDHSHSPGYSILSPLLRDYRAISPNSEATCFPVHLFWTKLWRTLCYHGVSSWLFIIQLCIDRVLSIISRIGKAVRYPPTTRQSWRKRPRLYPDLPATRVRRISPAPTKTKTA